MTGSGAARHIWWFFLIVLVGHTALVGANIYRASEDENWVTHTLQILHALDNLKALLVDAERSIRGYVISDEDDFLAPYRRAPAAIARLQEQLAVQMADNPLQTQRLEGLAQTIRHRFEVFEEQIKAHREIPRHVEREKALVLQGRKAAESLLDQLGVIVATEEELLSDRRAGARTTIVTSLLTTIMGGALTIGMLILARYVISREIETRRRSEELHRQNEERFRSISESLPQIVWVARPDGFRQYYNKRWYNFTGLSPDDSTGFGWHKAVHPNDQRPLSQAFQKAMLSGQPFELEYRLRHRTGVYRWHLDRAIPLCDKAGGRLVLWFGTATDIDDRKRAKDELEERVLARTAELMDAVAELNKEARERERATEELRVVAAELTRSNRDLEQFAYVASHDLQEPLRKIQAFGDRLQTTHGNQLAGSGQEYVTRMMSSAGRMRRLIDDLLAYSRVTMRPLPFTDVKLNETVREVLVDLEELTSRTNAQIEVGPLPTVRADPSQMRQLFQNLLSNAIKFHKPDTPPHVTVRAELLPRLPSDPESSMNRPAVRVEVTDQGIGFDPQYCDRIFQVFQRLHPRTEFEGTGIGLAIVRKIVDRHGGTVSATSRPGFGATFAVIMPTGMDEKNDDSSVVHSIAADGSAKS
jgi:PAS domain S-box-containing protein